MSDATLAARERIIATLVEFLPDELAAREAANPGYTLPVPEKYIRTRDEFEAAFMELNVNEVACWVVKESPARPNVWETGSTDGEMSADQTQRWRIVIIAAQSSAFDPEPLPEGRLPTIKEWMDTRAELFKGALIDVLPAYTADTINVHELYPSDNDATSIALQSTGALISQASLIVEVKQETIFTVKVNPAL